MIVKVYCTECGKIHQWYNIQNRRIAKRIKKENRNWICMPCTGNAVLKGLITGRQMGELIDKKLEANKYERSK